MSLAGLKTDTKRTCRCEMERMVSSVLSSIYGVGDVYLLEDKTPPSPVNRREKARELLEELFTIPECGRCKS